MTSATLPFYEYHADGNVKRCWNVAESGDYGADCSLGREYYNLALTEMQASSNPTILGRILQSQVEQGRWSGVEIGFTQAMAEDLLTI